jgi:cysteine synthase B
MTTLCRTPSVNVLDLVGNTPLLHLKNIGRDAPGVGLYAKAEWYNPGGSVKDRPALSMVLAAEREGLLTPDRTLLDATSGNTGIAYAMIGAARGFRVKLCMPSNASPERKRILKAYGAEMVLTSPMEGSDGAIREARRLIAEEPDRYFYCDQYSNPNNWLAHYHTTAVEIWEQTGGRVTHFVAGLGTSGTFIGTTRRLKEFNPAIRCVSFQPDAALHGLEGMKHMASAIVPPIYDPEVADEDRGIATEDAYEMVRRMAREEGLLVGISSGAAVYCALQVAKELSAQGKDGVVATILCDNADKYLSERFWDEF